MGFRLALVTGATSGIGRALVELLRAQQLCVLATGRNIQALEELKKIGAEVLAHDLTQGSKPVLQIIEQKVPDLVIHAAGFGYYGVTTQQTLPLAYQMLQVHVQAALEITLAAAETLQKHQQQGVILHLSSFAAELPTPGMAMYGASKACLTHLCQSLDFELAPQGIRVLVTCPGMVVTPFATRAAQRPFQHGAFVMSAQQAAEKIWKQINKRKAKTIIDWKYKILHLLLPFIPNFWLSQIFWRNVSKR